MSAQLQAWANEFCGIAGEKPPSPKLWAFIASRLSEMPDSSVQANPDEITIHIDGTPKRVTITGARAGRLLYKNCDGSVGFGMCKIEDVPDRSKLTEILERLHQQGKC